MHIPIPYFTNIPQSGSLTLDYIFVEDGYPILFTCKSTTKIYLCLCRTLVPEQKWIISETSIEILTKMANRTIPICDAFKLLNTKSCIALWSKVNPVERYSVFSTIDLQESDLPDNTLYLDEDDADDAIDYVKSLAREIALHAMLEIDSKLCCEGNSIYTTRHKITTSINYEYAAWQHIFEQAENSSNFSMKTFCSGNSLENIPRPTPSMVSEQDSISNDLKITVSDAA